FREVATLLLERITAGEKQDMPPAEVADLLCQLGILQANELGERAGGRRTFERALALVPDHASTLAESARLYLREEDYGAFARDSARPSCAEIRRRASRSSSSWRAFCASAPAIAPQQPKPSSAYWSAIPSMPRLCRVCSSWRSRTRAGRPRRGWPRNCSRSCP